MLLKSKIIQSSFFAVFISYPVQGHAEDSPIEKIHKEPLEVIQVTSTKRQESIIETPLALTLISAENIASYQTGNLAQLSDKLVNFSIGDGIVTTNVNMRGMGAGGDRGFEQSVGLYVDNIYMPRSRQYRAPFFDVERLEVIHGPQAVLYGINSTAGAVAVISKTTAPDDDAFIELSSSYETQTDLAQLSMIAAIPVNNNFALRLSAKTSQGENTVQNLYLNAPTNMRDEDIARLSTVWLASDNLSITTKYEYAAFNSEGYMGELFSEQGLADKFGEDGQLNYQNNVDHSLLKSYEKLNYKPGLFQVSNNLMVNIDWQLNNYLLTATLGSNKLDYQFAVDLDTSPLPLYDSAVNESYQQDSLELRLNSPSHDWLTYVVGLYWQQSELINQLDSGFNIDVGLPILSGGALTCQQLGLCGSAEYGGSYYQVDQDMASLFTQVNFQLTEQLSFEAGIRYVNEQKSLNRSDSCALFDPKSGKTLADGFLTCPSLTAQTSPLLLDRTSSNWMPELIMQYQFSDNAMAYLKSSQSVKSGGFASASSISLDTIEYDDEHAKTIELGYKTSLLDGQGRFLFTLFSTIYDDLQVNSFVDVTNAQGISEPASAIRNAGSATNAGIEVASDWLLNDFLSIGGKLALLDAKYNNFEKGTCAASSYEGQNGQQVCDQSGQTLAYAPKVSAVIYADINYPMMEAINLVSGFTTSYKGAHYTDSTNDIVGLQDDAITLSAYLGLVASDNTWQVRLYANNITDNTRLDITQYALGSYIGYAASPRIIGLQASYNFAL
jgi:outer membrane receptor protein involved in Fe transport